MGSLLIVITLILSLLYTNNRYEVVAYFNYQSQKQQFITKKKVHKKKNTEYIGDSTIIYQNPEDVKISGDNTNNLIYIYLESFENTF